MEHAAGKKVLPDNAYRVLGPGETYVPIVPAHKSIIEVSPRVFIYGIALNIIFTPAQPPQLSFDTGQPCPDARPSPPASYCPATNTITVDVPGKNYQIRARQGYRAKVR